MFNDVQAVTQTTAQTSQMFHDDDLAGEFEIDAASDAALLDTLFTLAIVTDKANLVVVIPGDDRAGMTGDLASPLDRAVALLPEAMPTHIAPATNPDLRRFFSALRQQKVHAGFLVIDLRIKPDATLEQLAASLLRAKQAEPASSELYANAIGATLAARIAEESPLRAEGARRPCGTLSKWRLKRAIEYIDAHLGETITLAEMAEAARLTRMHFAAQFRASTGLPPHAFLLRRRIDRAKQLLLDDRETIVGVALTVGFQTQAHFTTVFKRFVGDTPYQWRRAQAAGRTPARAQRRGVAQPGRVQAPAGRWPSHDASQGAMIS
ncbi:AraC family transcriptional regulator [Kaistia dalseonensis]|uniref:AraC-like DNA-binding protein n=1 Tax=Kaistia dalseonensis TaxID=410840 RepID=A0ABU0H7M7_9HYPH|nr:AraC family transcriptional regulator [Kaistia dalseonensis]MCX5495713.1 AraC family transcriptional regulator [Kaistia dalseonensis]MDQ0438309.1 AraC-like DNA-binding protein [Kaistia dalseonensis]